MSEKSAYRVIASAAKQSLLEEAIASSLALLAMTISLYVSSSI